MFTLRNDLSELGRVAGELETFGVSARLPLTVIFAVNLALEEVITNAISYGYEDEAEHVIQVELCAGDRAVVVTVQDDGRAFNPLAGPEVDVTAPLEARKVGGLGLLLLRKLTDGVTYARTDGKNILVFEKRINPSDPLNVDG
jgi:serine/threonine-protein kinase RsbW